MYIEKNNNLGDIMNIILLGPPGSGKGTQSEKICEKYGIGHISTGDVIRDNIKRQSEFGIYAKNIIEQGKLIPDEKMIPVLEEEMKKYPEGVLLDGFPRTIPQAEALEKADVGIDKVIDIEVPDSEIIERITGRRKGDDGKIYHIKYNPAPEGVSVTQRDDDKEETILKRLEVFNGETLPLVNYYQKQNMLTKINADQDLDDRFKEVEARLKELGLVGKK